MTKPPIKILQADANSFVRLGSIPCCIALGATDIGVARVDGRQVYITWGRNMPRAEQAGFMRRTSFELIHLIASDGEAEIVLPNEMVAPLLPLLNR